MIFIIDEITNEMLADLKDRFTDTWREWEQKWEDQRVKEPSPADILSEIKRLNRLEQRGDRNAARQRAVLEQRLKQVRAGTEKEFERNTLKARTVREQNRRERLKQETRDRAIKNDDLYGIY